MVYSSRRKSQTQCQTWCCSFTVPPSNPEKPSMPHSKAHPRKSKNLSKPSFSIPNSPQSAKYGLGRVGRIKPHQILSPGRVLPIDSNSNLEFIQDIRANHSTMIHSPQLRSQSFWEPTEKFRPPLESSDSSYRVKDAFNVRLNLRGKNGEGMNLELNSGVLSANSEVFAGLIADYENRLSSSASPGPKLCIIEVPKVQNLGIFKKNTEFMFEDNIMMQLKKIGVYRSSDILEAEYVKDLHAKVRANIERKNKQYATQANKSRTKIVFELGDWVWVHMRKERFLVQRKSKLHSRGDGPFQVLERINNNACDGFDSRTNPFEEGGNDGDQGAVKAILNRFQDPLQGISGPMTRSRAKRAKEVLLGLILDVQAKEEVVGLSPDIKWATLCGLEDCIKEGNSEAQ